MGVTGNFDRRVGQHKSGAIEGFTEKYACHRLVDYEIYDDAAKAIGREKQLKGWRREKKVALIERMNPRWNDLADCIRGCDSLQRLTRHRRSVRPVANRKTCGERAPNPARMFIDFPLGLRLHARNSR